MRILLVSHEASRTGAPRVAAMAARALVDQGHTVAVVSRSPGPLLVDLAEAAPTSVEPWGRVRRRLWTRRPTRPLALLLDTLVATSVLLRHRPELLYLNSTSSGAYVRPAGWIRVRVLLHAHESGAVAEHFLRANRVPPDLAGATLVACSPSVRTELADLTGRPVDEVVMVPSVPDGRLVDARAAEQDPTRTGPGPAGAGLLVAACGTVEHRKGADLWVEVADRVTALAPELDVTFRWVGDIADPVATDGPARTEFVGPRANPYPHLRRADLLTLTSRDDPFPLVVLEAMHLGTPVVAFGVGGVAAQVGDAGVVVPPGDVEQLAAAVVALLRDEDRRDELGRRARTRVARLYSTDTFSAALARLVGAPSGTA